MLTAKEIIQRKNKAEGERRTWETHIQQCFDYANPRDNQVLRYQWQGSQRREAVFDSTAIHSAERLANGMYTYLTPPTRRWFELKSKRWKHDEQVSRWFQDVTHITYEAIAMSNFPLQCHGLYLSLCVAGTGAMGIEEGVETPLEFRNIHFRQFFGQEGANGKVDMIFISWKLTARQAVQEFGIDNVGKEVAAAAVDPEKCNGEFEYIQAIYPRVEREWGKMDPGNMPIASAWVDVKRQVVLYESGYAEWPMPVPRWSKDTFEGIYGRSPTMAALPDIKMLNAMALTTIKAAQKRVDPPIVVPDDGVTKRISTAPASQIPWRPNQWQSRPEYLQFTGDIKLGLEMIDRQREIVRKAYYEDLFAMLLNYDGPQQTAFEVRERMDEKLTLFAPTWGRMESEFYNPAMDRIVGILSRGGYYPTPPDKVREDSSFEIEYKGKLATLLSAMELQSVENTLMGLAPIVELKPDILDYVRLDEMPAFFSEKYGMSPRLVRTDKEVQDIRAQRAMEEQAMQEAAMAIEAGKVAPGLNQQVVPGSPLDRIVGQIAGG